MPKRCAFCSKESPEIKMSKEHIIRAALAKYIPTTLQNSHTVQRYIQPLDGEVVTRVIDIPQPFLNQTVNKVCKDCNEGWLNNKVEIPAEPQLVKLIKGESVQLSANDMDNLALWAAKTAAVRALSDPKPRAIPSEHYEHIMLNLRPPLGTFIWLSTLELADNTFSRHLRFRISNSDGTIVGRFHQTTILLGHAAFFVLGVSNSDLINPIMKDAISFFDSSEAIRLYPNANLSNCSPSQISSSIAKARSNLSLLLNAEIEDSSIPLF